MIQIKALKSVRNAITNIVTDEINSSSVNGKKLLFIVPETSKASVERIIFDKVLSSKSEGITVGESKITSSIIEYDVLSFIKLSERIITSCGSELENKSDDLLLRNVIYRVFMDHGDEFRTLSKYVKRFEYIDMLINLLGDFTRYGVGKSNLDEVLNNAKTEDTFYNKVYDLRLLISYIEEANEQYGYTLLDSFLNKARLVIEKVNKNPSLLNKRLYSSIRAFKETRLVIYGFGSIRTFTPQEMELLESLNHLGIEIVVYPLCDLSDTEADLYWFGHKLIDSLRRKNLVGSIEQYNGSNDVANSFQKISSAYAMNEEIIVEEDSNSGKTASLDGSVNLIKMTDCDDMLSYVCNEIIRLTRIEGYRYKDIRVFCPNESITERFKGIMHLYQLDAFIDRTVVLDETPAMRYVNILLELPLNGYPVEDVLRLLRTGLLPVPSEIADYYENYCKARNITFENRIFDESYYITDPKHQFKMYVHDKVIEHGAEYLGKVVLDKVLRPIKDVLIRLEAAVTLMDKANILMEHLDTVRPCVEALTKEYYKNKHSDDASAIVRGYKEVMSLLATFSSEANNVQITLSQFASLINVDMRNKVIGTIPLTADSIEIVSNNTACYTPCKVLFMVGCNSTNFPHKGVSEGIMNNSELLRLNDEISVELPDKAMSQSKEEFIESALILSLCSDRTYMFVLEPDFESSVMEFFKQALSIKDLVRKEYETPIYGLPVDKRHDCVTAQINPDSIKELFGAETTMSVSALEMYNKCAMQYMLDRVLKIRKREDNTNVQLNEIGSLVHNMFEDALRDIVSENSTVDELKSYLEGLDESLLSDLASTYFDKARLVSASPDKNTAMYEIMPGIKTKRIFMKALPKLLKYCVDEKYVPRFYEQDITKLDVPFNVTTDNDITFKFTGFIDRVDVNEENGNLRIVDYKTGAKKIDLKEFIAGVQIQLFAYALALSMQNDEVKIDNVGYIEAGIDPSTPDKKKEPFTYEGSKFNVDTIGDPIRYVDFIIRKNCKDIASGRADALLNSRAEKSCTYCPYSGICGNDPGNVKKRVVYEDFEFSEDEKEKYKEGRSLSTNYYVEIMKRNEKEGK